MFVKRSTVRRGNHVYEYLSLVEAYRDKAGKTRHRTLLRLGEASALRDSGELDRMVAVLKRHTAADTAPVDGLQAESAPGLGAVAAVAAVWRRPGLGTHFGVASPPMRSLPWWPTG